MLNALSGIGALQDQLVRTNELLDQVLSELKRVNDEGLTQVVEELRRQNA
ncbi:hypothetical protein SAMN04488570_2759 [Nocardioides scoriae]|uniref:Uncharacterized protein n=1 Tax=Nocardioides scoriae TaxID=642780 RepID=A0A1H1VAL2_9ACTN|nr:hypothetical protein [Nocardioides scoriae]SDS81309.1 hypothetical protein SAMN04488570_2759 [Nocardioides scoriae]